MSEARSDWADEFDKQHADLLARGYVDIDEIKGLRVGSRCHHANQRYVEAYWDGTAEVLAITEKLDSPWSRRWGDRDIELIVLRDGPVLPGLSRLGYWADYHTAVPSGRPDIWVSR